MALIAAIPADQPMRDRNLPELVLRASVPHTIFDAAAQFDLCPGRSMESVSKLIVAVPGHRLQIAAGH